MKKTFSALLLTLVLTAFPASSEASLIVGNFGSVQDGTRVARSNIQWAHRFDTGSGGATVSSILTEFDSDSGLGNNGTSLSSFTLTLLDDSGTNGSPGAQLGGFDFDSLSGETVTFGDGTTTVTLDPNRSYWLGYTSTGANEVFYTTSNSTTEPGSLSGWSFATTNNYVGDDSSANGWSSSISSQDVPLVQLMGTSTTAAVPEPSTSVLLLGLFGGLLAFRKRRSLGEQSA